MRGRVAIWAAALSLATAAPTPAPRVAAHEHLLSPATAALLGLAPYDGAALIADLDRAGIARGVVLSMAYTYADDRKHVADPDAAVARENSWTSAQIVAAQGRLIGFCGVNPLRAAAAAELARCARLPGMRGLKLHFGNSGVSLRDAATRARVTALFAQADRLRLPIVVHLRARTGTPYGAADAQAFIAGPLAAAPHSWVQVAHLGGGGLFPGDAQAVMATFADAIARRDPRVRHLMFDLTSVALPETPPDEATAATAAMRRVGLRRVLFGTDLPVAGNCAPAACWALAASKLALTSPELATIAANRPPYWR